jgi:predicted transcriptional regulator
MHTAMKAPTVVLTVRVPPELRERVARMAGRYSLGRPATAAVTIEALTLGLDELDRRRQAELFVPAISDHDGHQVPKPRRRRG